MTTPTKEQLRKLAEEQAKTWPNIPITRSPDGTPVVLELVPKVGSRQEWENKIYYGYPDIIVKDEDGKVTEDRLDQVIAFLGREKAATLFERMLNGIAQTAYWNSTHDMQTVTQVNKHSGKEETVEVAIEKDLDKEELIRYHEQQSAAGEPITELKARRDDLIKKMGSLIAKSTSIGPDGKPTVNMELFMQVQKITAEVGQLTIDIDSRKRGPRKSKDEGEDNNNEQDNKEQVTAQG